MIDNEPYEYAGNPTSAPEGFRLRRHNEKLRKSDFIYLDALGSRKAGWYHPLSKEVNRCGNDGVQCERGFRRAVRVRINPLTRRTK